jgi:hypothetical protein
MDLERKIIFRTRVRSTSHDAWFWWPREYWRSEEIPSFEELVHTGERERSAKHRVSRLSCEE